MSRSYYATGWSWRSLTTFFTGKLRKTCTGCTCCTSCTGWFIRNCTVRWNILAEKGYISWLKRGYYHLEWRKKYYILSQESAAVLKKPTSHQTSSLTWNHHFNPVYRDCINRPWHWWLWVFASGHRLLHPLHTGIPYKKSSIMPQNKKAIQWLYPKIWHPSTYPPWSKQRIRQQAFPSINKTVWSQATKDYPVPSANQLNYWMHEFSDLQCAENLNR